MISYQRREIGSRDKAEIKRVYVLIKQGYASCYVKEQIRDIKYTYELERSTISKFKHVDVLDKI